MNNTNPTQIYATGEATGFIPALCDKDKPIAVIGTNSFAPSGFDDLLGLEPRTALRLPWAIIFRSDGALNL